jgi:hypothetical protein
MDFTEDLMGRVICELLSTQYLDPRYKDKDGRKVIHHYPYFKKDWMIHAED